MRTEYTGCGAPNVFVVEDLKPSSAYMFRLFEVGEDGHFGAPGPEVTFHTKGMSVVLKGRVPGSCFLGMPCLPRLGMFSFSLNAVVGH